MLLNATLFGLEAGFILQVYCNAVNYTYACFTFMAGTVIWFLTMLQPSTYTPSDEEKSGYRFLFGSFNRRMLIAGSVMLLLVIIEDIAYNGSNIIWLRDYSAWLLLYIIITLLLIGIVFSLYVLIHNIEKQTVNKWYVIINEASRYSDSAGVVSPVNYGELLPKNNSYSDKYIDELDILKKNIDTIEENINDNLIKLSGTLRERRSIEAKLEVATSIQQGILPDLTDLSCVFRQNGYNVYAGMKAAKFVGGDMYNCIQIDDDHMLIMVGDVAGKGVPGALFMMVTQTLVKQNGISYGLSPSNIVAATNDTLAARNRESLFVTMWLGILELSTGRLRYTNAGHNPPILAYSGKANWIQNISGPVLGLMDGMEYRTYEMTLPPDSKLLLYTDGINEAEDGKGGFYGNKRLRAAFLASDYPDALLDDISEFVDGAAQSDDMTYLWLERKAIKNAMEEAV